MEPVTRQRLGKHVPAVAGTHATEETVCSLCGPRGEVIKKRIGATSSVEGGQSALYWNIEGRT
jgi:hypothetical protein